MNIETPYDSWAATAPGAGSASPPRPGAAARGTAGEAGDRPFHLFGEDGFSFADLIDVVNPLQHIPIVSTLYRAATADTLDPGARLLGGTLFFGPLGTVGAGVNVLVEHETGRDLGDHLAALFDDEEAAIAVADAGAAAHPGPALVAGGTDGSEPVADAQQDPVSAWARREVAWAAAQADAHGIAPPMMPEARRQAMPEARPAPPLPDAGRLLRRTPAAAGAPSAGLGDWFSETVLSANAKYLAAQRLAAPAGES